MAHYTVILSEQQVRILQSGCTVGEQQQISILRLDCTVSEQQISGVTEKLTDIYY